AVKVGRGVPEVEEHGRHAVAEIAPRARDGHARVLEDAILLRDGERVHGVEQVARTDVVTDEGVVVVCGTRLPRIEAGVRLLVGEELLPGRRPAVVAGRALR